MHLLKKHLGQHFLHDQRIIHKIIAAINPKIGEHLVEIGPGAGALTTQILPLAKELDAIEIDRDIIPVLEEKCRDLGTLRVHQCDILKFDFANLPHKPLRVFGNLPYNISSPLIFHVLKIVNIINDMHFMLQLEVAERMVAAPGTKIYGRLSVMIQYYCEAEILFNVGCGAFTPPPKVDSAVVRLVPRKKREVEAKDINLFEKIVRTAFCQRRKMLRNSLKEFNVDSTLRPEQLSVADFVRICNAI